MCNSLWIHFCHSYTKYAILSSMNSSYSNNFMYKGTWGCVNLMLLLTSVIPMCKFSGDNLLLIYNSVWIYFWITPILKLLITHLLTKQVPLLHSQENKHHDNCQSVLQVLPYENPMVSWKWNKERDRSRYQWYQHRLRSP